MSRGFTHETAVSGSVEWLTPKSVFDALGVAFDLDPCSPGQGLTHVPARRALTEADDGLAHHWSGRVWLNPPYGRGISTWLQRAEEHAISGAGSVIALVPARTDTAWFQHFAARADGLLLHAGRISFHRGDKDAPPTGSPGTGSAFLAFGSWAAWKLHDSNLPGLYVGRPGTPLRPGSPLERKDTP